MGRVFRFEEAVGGQVPTQSDFRVAAENFDINCLEATERGEIVGSVVFGSVAIEGATLRSDFDCLIVTHGTKESFMAARRIVEYVDWETSRRVEVSPIPYSRETLASGRHEIDRFFGQHLTGPDRIVRGEDVADFISYDDAPPLDIFNTYARNKKRRITTGLVSTDPSEQYMSLQRFTELPLAIGRKLIKVVEETKGAAESRLQHTADKTSVRDMSLETYDAMGLDVVPRFILELDADYTQLLKKTVTGFVDRPEYEEFIDELHGTIPLAIRWLNGLDQVLPDYLREIA